MVYGVVINGAYSEVWWDRSARQVILWALLVAVVG